MKNQYILFLLFVFVAACKKDDKPGGGTVEGQKIEAAMIGQKYKISTITDQNGTDIRAKFAPCTFDDIYLIKDRGTVEITQGANKCGKESLDLKNASWGVAYNDNEVVAIQFPLFNPGTDYYQTREFLKPVLSDITSGNVKLSLRVGTDTYTILLTKTM
ncbi:hypothetical protein FHW36_11850 [Chitinophaga polysaccharea]|uniref:Uncharacterized protein n=1 Tax=Chitinophaga polysaccharea TaxID=1293035 RepID=A0A561P0U8_9BACT|nr:hypothetical protein [Chitinophaga polysaccharea]TWF31756.1 hypothetical protein FHW36_11850 [Chitinophaga polysaccharea]